MPKFKKIRDLVYGFIILDEQECAVIDHPVFQRLRRIKQLSLTDMVYPGATHYYYHIFIYLYQTYTVNNWTCNMEEVSKNVHEIKPHFDISTIQREYRYLEETGVLQQGI